VLVWSVRRLISVLVFRGKLGDRRIVLLRSGSCALIWGHSLDATERYREPSLFTVPGLIAGRFEMETQNVRFRR
jgi:hypothetical protein